MKIQHVRFAAAALGDLFVAVDPALARDSSLTAAPDGPRENWPARSAPVLAAQALSTIKQLPHLFERNALPAPVHH